MWPFTPKQPLISIAKDRWRLRVYIPSRNAPDLLTIANVRGTDGAMRGFIVPLDKSPNQVDLKRARLWPGRYGVVTPDKKSALSIGVQEVGLIPGAAEEAVQSARAEGEAINTSLARLLREDPLVAELTISETGPDGIRAAELIHSVADRIALLGQGLVRDVALKRWWEAGMWTKRDRLKGPHLAVSHVVVFAITREGGGETWVHTLGLFRFGKSELEVFLTDPKLSEVAGEYLLEVATYLMTGKVINEGEIVGERKMRFVARAGTRREVNWGGMKVLELVALGPADEQFPSADTVFKRKIGES